MEPGCIETYFGLKLVILGRNCSSRQCQKVSRKSGVILEVFSTSPEFGRKAEIREAVGALLQSHIKKRILYMSPATQTWELDDFP